MLGGSMDIRRRVMDRRRRVAEARLTMALEAGRRWQQRAFERTGAQQQLETRGPIQADTADRAAQFEAREAQRRRNRAAEAAEGFPVTKERMIGPTLDFTSYAPDEEARRVGRP